MPISRTVAAYLASKGLKYQVHEYSPGASLQQIAAGLGIPASNIAKMDLLQDGPLSLMAVYSANRKLDLDAINRQLQRDYRKVKDDNEISIRIPDSDKGAWAPLGDLYKIQVIVDFRLGELDEVYFIGGRHGSLVQVNDEGFHELVADAMHGTSISSESGAEDESDFGMTEHKINMRERVKQVRHLPPVPQVAKDLLLLRNNMYANASDLASIIEMDPSLSAQLIRYAKSPLYNYRGNINSIRDVIARVLGYELVMDIALGVALGRNLRVPKGGPLGIDAFWRHAVYSASIAQRLVNVMNIEPKPEPGIAYLCGLLHNFGFLLLGHLFKEDFMLLNKAFASRRETPIVELENEILGVNHLELGTWLMKAWDLPGQIITTIREHHNPDYAGEHAIYANMVFMADRLLKSLDLGDAESEDVPEEMMLRYGLSFDKLEMVLHTTVEEGRDALNSMATQLAA